MFYLFLIIILFLLNDPLTANIKKKTVVFVICHGAKVVFENFAYSYKVLQFCFLNS